MNRPLVSLAAAAVLFAAGSPAGAQQDRSMTVRAADSSSFIVARRGPAASEPSLRTTDRNVVLILRDSVIVLQFTDRGMESIVKDDDSTTSRGLGEAFFARMMRAGVSGLMDHGVAYRLSLLRRAYVDGNVLVLEDRNGKRVFEDTSYNGHHPMGEFATGDAERFATIVQRAIDARR